MTTPHDVIALYVWLIERRTTWPDKFAMLWWCIGVAHCERLSDEELYKCPAE